MYEFLVSKKGDSLTVQSGVPGEIPDGIYHVTGNMDDGHRSIHIVHRSFDDVTPVIQAAFEQHGLPDGNAGPDRPDAP